MTSKPFPYPTTLADLPAAELAKYSRKLVSITTTTTLDEALEVLHRQNILSVPVRNEETNEWVGILTIQDLLYYIAFKDFKDGSLSEDFDNGKRAAGEVMLQRDTPLPIADVSETVADVLEPLCKGLHRMMVQMPYYPPTDLSRRRVAAEDAELRLVTQTDAIKCALLLDDVAMWDKTLDELSVIQGEVQTIKDTDAAISGFRRMGLEDVSALAVVSNADGKLIGTLSASDLRGLTSNLIHRVLMPVADFIKERNFGRLAKPVAFTGSVTLREAVNNMMWRRVHRVWIVNEDSQPIGVFTSTDVIKHLFDINLANRS